MFITPCHSREGVFVFFSVKGMCWVYASKTFGTGFENRFMTIGFTH